MYACCMFDLLSKMGKLEYLLWATTSWIRFNIKMSDEETTIRTAEQLGKVKVVKVLIYMCTCNWVCLYCTCICWAMKWNKVLKYIHFSSVRYLLITRIKVHDRCKDSLTRVRKRGCVNKNRRRHAVHRINVMHTY